MRSLLRRATPEARAVFAGSLVATLLLWAVVGFPLRALTTHLIGLGGDPLQTFWRFYASAAAAASGTLTVPGDPIRNLSAFPWLPLHWLFGEPLAMNLMWLLQGLLTMVAVTALARRLGIARWPAVLAGLLVTVAPYRIAQSLGHFGAFQLWWIAAVLAALLWWRERPSLPRMGLAAAILVGTAWTEHTLFLTALIGVVLATVVAARAFNRPVREHHVQFLVGVCLVLLGAVVPFRDEFRSAVQQTSPLRTDAAQRARFTPSISSLLLPSPTHLFRSGSAPYGGPRSTVADHVHALGTFAVLLAGFGVVTLVRKGQRQTAVLLGSLASAGILLALLPVLPAVASLADRLPLLSAVRTVDRFLALSVVTLPLLCSAALSSFRRPLAVAAVLVLVAEILPARVPMIDLASVFAAGALVQEGGGALVVDVAAASDYLVASEALAASALTGKNSVGHIAFERVDDRESRDALLRFPGLRDLLLLRTLDLERPTLFGQTPAGAIRASLEAIGAQIVTLRFRVQGERPLRVSLEGTVPAEASNLETVRRVLSAAGFKGTCVAETLCVYQAPAPAGTSVVVGTGLGWGTTSRDEAGTVRVTVRDGAELLLRVRGGPVPVALAFVPRMSQPQLLRLDDQPDKVRLVPGRRTIVPVPPLTEGAHTVTLHIDAPSFVMENPSLLLLP